tara:strand:- start:422 stop:1588 length:1167 start_codon:yes stop_codon:yes gene_type:complete
MEKNTKYYLLTIFLTISVIYGLLVIGDYFYHLYQYSKMRPTNDILTERKKSEDRKYLIELKENGFKKIIFPWVYDNYPEVSKKFIKDIVPISAQPNQNVYYCNEGYGMINFKTDRAGFRNNDKVWDKIISSENIIFIGDSYTQGACVEENETISSYFNDKNPINLGLDGNMPYVYTVLSKLFVPKIKPKYVVQIFHLNDDNDEGGIFRKNLNLENLDQRYFKTNSFEPSNEILTIINKTNEYVDRNLTQVPGERESKLKRGMRYLSLPTVRYNLNELFRSFIYKLPYSTTLSIDTLKNICIENNCTPIFLYIPVSKYWEDNKPLEKYYMNYLNKYFEEQNVHYLDVSEGIYKMGNSAFAPKGKHLSPEGYKFVASEIRRKINTIEQKD